MKKTHNPQSTNEIRKGLRTKMPPAEVKLWQALKNKKLAGKKFRRQHGIEQWIVDFYCPEAKLIVELDGESHNSPQNREYDEQRQNSLQMMGFTILRFENKEVFNDFENVLNSIRCYLE